MAAKHVEFQIQSVEVSQKNPQPIPPPPSAGSGFIVSYQDFFQPTTLENITLVLFLLSLVLLVTLVSYVGYRTLKFWMEQKKAGLNTLEMAEKHQQHTTTMQEWSTEHRKQVNATWTAPPAGM